MKKPVSSLMIRKKIQGYQKKLSNEYFYSNETEVKCRKDQENYFYSSSSSNDDYMSTSQKIVEKTANNAFGRFEEILGSGSFKRVYKGYDFNAGREIAWSVINVTSSSHHDIKKITDEINILKQLNHSNIIHYISGWYDDTKKQVIIITEIVSGGSLKENLKRIKEPRLRLIKKWIKQILSGLDYLHKKNIIHRDLKCDNIFLDKIFGNVKIGDLGGSELLYRKYGKNYVGTEEFMAPEVIEGKYTVKADIYSLGMSIIEMLTLEKPYKECDVPMAVYYNITHGIYPESLNKINDTNMVNFINLCLKREHERPSASDLLLNNAYLNDDLSDENNYPINIINHLRQNSFSSKFQAEIKPILNLNKVPSYKKNELDSINHSYQNSSFNSIEQKFIYDSNKEVVSDISSNKTFDEYKNVIRTESTKIPINSFNKIISPPNSPIHQSGKNVKLKKKCSSFIISIKEQKHISSEKDHTSKSNGNQLNQPLTPLQINNHSEVEITFIVKKEEWKNKKLLKCPYNFDTDTVDGLASELQKAINLSDEDYNIVKHKLNESITKYTSASTCNSQRNTESSFLSDIKQKCKYDEFLSSFTHLTKRIESLLNNDSSKRLEEIVKCIKNTKEISKNYIQHKIDHFKEKEKCLLSLMSSGNYK